jgi:hypothetical protein
VSYITDILVIQTFGPCDADVAALNAWIADAFREQYGDLFTEDLIQRLEPISMKEAGGRKNFGDKRVWAAAINYAPEGIVEKACELLLHGFVYVDVNSDTQYYFLEGRRLDWVSA